MLDGLILWIMAPLRSPTKRLDFVPRVLPIIRYFVNSGPRRQPKWTLGFGSGNLRSMPSIRCVSIFLVDRLGAFGQIVVSEFAPNDLNS